MACPLHRLGLGPTPGAQSDHLSSPLHGGHQRTCAQNLLAGVCHLFRGMQVAARLLLEAHVDSRTIGPRTTGTPATAAYCINKTIT